jgi:hypothetical protein
MNMKTAFKLFIFPVFILWLFLRVPVVSFANEFQPLPRSFGSFNLGVTVEEFVALTGIEPEACYECREGESQAGIRATDLPKLFPSYYNELSGWQQGADLFFFSGRLYRIDVFPEIKDIETALGKYSAIYDDPVKIEDWKNGLSWAIWEDSKTRMSLPYVRVRGDSYPLNQPVGTVTLMRIEDINVSF